MSCTKAKTHCDLVHPSCSRCAAKDLTCSFSQLQTIPAPAATLHNSTEVPTELSLISNPGFDLACDFSSVDDPAKLVLSDSPRYGSWNWESTDTSLAYSQDVTTRTVQPYVRASPRLPHLDPDSFTDISNLEIEDALLFAPIFLKAPKAFWPRKALDRHFSLNKNYVLCTLRSYPYTMAPGETLPPFIHPECSADFSRDHRMGRKPLLEPLATCMAIVQMCSLKDDSNAIFIWKTIRMEQEKIAAEVRHNYTFLLLR